MSDSVGALRAERAALGRPYNAGMEIRGATLGDLRAVADIDGTVDSREYLHLERTGEDLSISFKLEPRPLRERLIDPNRMTDEQKFALRQIVEGLDDGVALVVELDGDAQAFALAKPDPEFQVMRVLDLRIDFDLRRQGMGTALLLQIVQKAREQDLRAVAVEILANNIPAARMFQKLGFELAGIDTFRRSNHDLVKERATLFWYAAIS